MGFALTGEQKQLKQTARAFLTERYPAQAINDLATSKPPTDMQLWPELVRRGWLDYDLGPVERGLLAEASGYALMPAPWWQTAGPGAVIREAAGEKDTNPVAIAGLLSATPVVKATASGTRWTLMGKAPHTPDAELATEILTTAVIAGGTAVFAVSAENAGMLAREGHDPLRPMCDLRFLDAPARFLVSTVDSGRVMQVASRAAIALLACEGIGIAHRALDMAVEHAKNETPPDRPNATFQAVAHQLTDAYAELEAVRALAYRAAWLTGTVDAAGAETGQALSSAIAASRRAAMTCTENARQVIGDTALTPEHPLHRWHRRALWLQAFGGANLPS